MEDPSSLRGKCLEVIERHDTVPHGEQDGGGAVGDGGAGGRSRLAKIPRPSVSGVCSQEEYNFSRVNGRDM